MEARPKPKPRGRGRGQGQNFGLEDLTPLSSCDEDGPILFGVIVMETNRQTDRQDQLLYTAQ